MCSPEHGKKPKRYWKISPTDDIESESETLESLEC